MLHAAFFAAALALGLQPTDPLTIGAKAPAFGDKAVWLKGEPVPEFEKGRVYVIDFWATWCAPCIANMPHLSELARTHEDDLTVVAMAIWQDQVPGAMSPRAFVEQGETEMDFVVAHDTTGQIAMEWMESQGFYGIPQTMVVDRQGRLAWTGHPMAGLDEVVESVIKGEFDVQAAAERNRNAARGAEFIQRANQAAMQGDWDKSLALIDQAVAASPEDYAQYAVSKFQLLVGQLNRRDDGYAYGRKIVDTVIKDDPVLLDSLAWFLVDVISPAANANPDLELALKASKRSNELSEWTNASFMDTLAAVHFARGDVKQALELQRRAVNQLEATKGQYRPMDHRALREQLQQRLDKYAAAVEKTGD